MHGGMMGQLEALPIWAVYIGLVVLMLAACELGFLFGRHHHRRGQDGAAPAAIGAMVGGLLSMLAFVLGLSFSMASSQHGQRKQNVLEEANAIGTAYLRADLLQPESAQQLRDLLREYVQVRLDAAQNGSPLPVLQRSLSRSLAIHNLLWQVAAEQARLEPTSNTSLVLQSLNAVIDMHEQRITGALHARIPLMVWLGLLAITLLTMATLGLQSGLSGKRRLVGMLPLTLAFAVLVALVVDLNRPQGGLITVSQQPMLDLLPSMDSR